MRVINARNVNDAWAAAIPIIFSEGERRPSRAGDVLVHPEPVATVYHSPTERVLLDPVRNANPMFHLHEALWMLAGRDDARWLDIFVSDFSSRFAEPHGRQHGAYGKRWRGWFDRSGHDGRPLDQLDEAVRLLRADPYDRQVVIQMWDPSADLGVPGLRDRPCNQQVLLRADRTTRPPAESDPVPATRPILDMTVTCRSNDIVWGCYGANAVHMSVLQEYLAARCGYAVGTYTQVSNNWHMYESTRHLADATSATAAATRLYPTVRPLVDDPESFDREVRAYCDMLANEDRPHLPRPNNSFLSDVAYPMYRVARAARERDAQAARDWSWNVRAGDWRTATVEWIERRFR